MAWIESHTVLIRHRKLKEFARELRLSPVYALGHLHALWHATLEQAEDGDLSSWSDEFIADSACFPGDAPQFVRLLQKHRWLDGKVVHDWLDYAGTYLTSKYKSSNRPHLSSIWLKHGRKYGGSGKEVERKEEGSPPVPTYLDLPTHPPTERGRGRDGPPIDRPVELPDRFPASPDDAIRMAATTGATALFITDTWNKAVSRGGRDAKDQVIRSWPHYVASELKYERERTEKARLGGTTTNGADTVKFNDEYNRLLKRMEGIRGQYADHQTWATDDRKEFNRLKARKLELKKLLNIVV